MLQFDNGGVLYKGSYETLSSCTLNMQTEYKR